MLLGLDSIVALMFGRSYGNLPSYAATAAVTAPLLPWPVWGLVGWLLWERNAVGALLAFAAGGVAVNISKRASGWPISICIVGALVASQWYWKGLLKGTLFVRLEVWGLALADQTMATVLGGHGLAGWTERIAPTAALRFHETWPVATNEPLEVFYALGLLGTLPALALLWHWRRVFVDPVWGGALVALGVMALSFPALHYVPLMVIGGAGVVAALGGRM